MPLKAGGADKKGKNANDASNSRMRQNYEQEDIEDEKDLFDPFGELMGQKTDTLPKIFGLSSALASLTLIINSLTQ